MDQRINFWTTPLMDASLLGHFDVVSQLLDSRVEEINQKDDSGWTAMHYASAAGHTEIVELLLTRGAGVNCTTDKNESCLLLAAWNGHDEVVRVLVSAGADVNPQRDDGFSPLHTAGHGGNSDILKLMLDRIAQVNRVNNDRIPLTLGHVYPDKQYVGADMNSMTNESETCLLMYAFEVLKSLVRAYASTTFVNSQRKYDIARLHVREFIGVMKHFLKDSQVYTEDNFYSTIPIFCALLPRYDRGDYYDDDDYHYGFTHWSARVADVCSRINTTARFLLSNMAEGQISLLCARVTAEVDDDTSLYKTSQRELRYMYIHIVTLLLDNGLKTETRDKHGRTPLFTGADQGHTDEVKLLLNKGADGNSVTIYNEGCLMRAAYKGHTDVVRVLVSAGADNLQGDDVGVSPLHAACIIAEGNDVAKVLLENDNQHGANVDAADIHGDRPLHKAASHALDVVQLLVQHGAKLNVQNNDGKTPLHVAVENEQPDVIMFLLSQDADVGLTDVWRNTPLHYVTSKLLKLKGFAEYITKILTVKFRNPVTRNAVGVSAVQHNVAHGLLDYQFHDTRCFGNNNKQMYVDCHGNTPLHRAVGVYGRLEWFNKDYNVSKAVRFLVKHGADINAQNHAGFTPLHVAQGNKEIKACLRHADDRSFTITDSKGRNFWHLFIISIKDRCDDLIRSDLLRMIPSSAVYRCDNLRRTPLHYAIRDRYKRNEFTSSFINRLNGELIVNKQDKFGRTALHYAAIDNNQALVDLLVTKKADRKIQDTFGKTAEEYVLMRDMFDTNVRLQLPTAKSLFAASYYHAIPICIKRCSEDRYSDSAQYEAKLRKMIQDFRGSVDITSYVRDVPIRLLRTVLQKMPVTDGLFIRTG